MALEPCALTAWPQGTPRIWGLVLMNPSGPVGGEQTLWGLSSLASLVGVPGLGPEVCVGGSNLATPPAAPCATQCGSGPPGSPSGSF